MAEIDPQSSTMALASGPVIQPLPWFETLGAPVLWDSNDATGNATFHFSVQASNAGAAEAIALSTIQSSDDTPIPSSVKVWTWLRSAPGTSSSTVVAFAQRQFTTFQLDVNGRVDYADLAAGVNCSQAQLSSGRWMVTAVIDNSKINAFDVGNTFDVRLNHPALPAGPEVIHEDMITTP